MSRLFRLFRIGLTWAVLATLAALLGEFAIELAREHGAFEHPTQRVEATLRLLDTVQGYPWFWPTLFGAGGLVAGMWLDSLVRRRSTESRATVIPADDSVSFGIRTSYVETSARSLVGKSIIRCDVWAKNNTAMYLDGCQFNAVVTNFELGTKKEKFAGSLPQGATARLHICDIMIANLSGELLYYRSDETSDFQELRSETLIITIDVQFLSKDIGILKKTLLIRGLMAVHEHIVIVDDKEEIENLMDSMRPDDDV